MRIMSKVKSMELAKTINLLKAQFNPRHFFEELLEALLKKEVLNNVEFEAVQQQLLELLAKQVGRFNKDSSSSIKFEVAESLMDSIYYTLSIYFKSVEDLGCSGTLIKEKGIEALFNEGRVLISKKVDAAKRLLECVQQTKLTTANYAYNDTIDYGLPLFFKAYDQDFAAQDSPGSVDYFLSYTERQEIVADGVEHVEKYLSYLYLENVFCGYFDNEEIEEILYSYDKQYEHLLFNIFDSVLMNSLGNILLNNEEGRLILKEEEVKILQEQLESYTLEELEQVLKKAAMQLCEAFHIRETPLLIYINGAISKIGVELKQRLELKQIQHIFLPYRPKQAQTYFIDGERMSDEDFKKLTDKIRECSAAKDKVRLIKDYIHSMYDLVDVLEAGCLFEEEYLSVFEALTITEINLLVNGEPELWERKEELGPVHVETLKDTIQTLMNYQATKNEQAEDEKEWQHWLLIYLKHHLQK